MNASVSGDSEATIQGWDSGPDTRGTSDIIWSSFLTIFLCTWTAVCLNIPHPTDSQYNILLRKAKWMLWAIVGPEIVLAVAIGQLASARRSTKRFHKLGHYNWTTRHGFFADMGGIILQPASSAPFVANGRQLAYLVEKRYIQYSSIPSVQKIWDKSKADTLSRLITIIQASWLVIHLLGRAALCLPTTTLELSAGAIVFCTFGTWVCWFHKPSDVTKGITITIEATTAQILIEAGDIAAKPYQHTPLDFVAKEQFTCSYVMRFFGIRCDKAQRPLQQFPNDRFPDIGTWEKLALFGLSSAYAASHMIAWNYSFPTRIERLLWRVSSSLFTGVTVAFWIFETIAARHRFGRWDKYLIWLKLKKRTRRSLQDEENKSNVQRQGTIDRLDAFEQEQRNAKPLPFSEVALMLPVVLLYVAARTYMIVEVFVSLRKVPAGVYNTFEFANILPHW